MPNGTVTINATLFLEEISGIHQELCDQLSDLQGICSDPQRFTVSPEQFLTLLRQLFDRLDVFVALDEIGIQFHDCFEDTASIEILPRTET